MNVKFHLGELRHERVNGLHAVDANSLPAARHYFLHQKVKLSERARGDSFGPSSRSRYFFAAFSAALYERTSPSDSAS